MTFRREPTASTEISTTDVDATADRKLDALMKQLARLPGSGRVFARKLASGTKLGSGRFTVIRELGEGGMGAVYEVHDKDRNCCVALKTLTKVEPTSLYRFKNEFRLLAGTSHANLVRLYELFAEGDSWFFTMELVEGVPFSNWVRPGGQLEPRRLRAALRDLCLGLGTVHKRGCLHRDLKPSNVLVSNAGRVVLLDFGLAVEPDLGGVGNTVDTFGIFGTPDYMAPEQAAGAPATAASDVYALGVMLFEALTGRRPFSGRPGEVLASKQRDDPPTLQALGFDVPSDLGDLCNELLARDPSKRPSLDTVQRCLGVVRESGIYADARPLGAGLIGRGAELTVLREAYQQTLTGQPVIVVVSGESGIGKTALCDEFVGSLRRQGGAVVLAGRCREQETVPFKALDSLMDELSRYLRRLPTDGAAALLPRDAFALRTLFPVLARIEAIAQAPAPTDLAVHELRRRAFSAAGELFARIRDRQPLVVCLDDLQWTDADSTAMLRHLLVDRNPIACLLILVHRNDKAERGLMTEVIEAAASNVSLQLRRLSLAPLSESDTERLAQDLLQREGVADPELCGTIARESAGSPFFAAELARLTLASTVSSERGPSLSVAVRTRVSLLPAGAQRALELLALVGRPMAADQLLAASRGSPSDIDYLRAEQLVRGRSDGPGRLLECYHDRIREIVGAALPDERRLAHYRALAEVLRANESVDLELLSSCLENIGDQAGASQCAASAAEQAAAALAFDRAASLFARALRLGQPNPLARQRRLLVGLASALEHAGRGREAAENYRSAAALSGEDDAIELRRHAAEQLLTTGHLEEGLALLQDVCRDLRHHVPWGDRSAMLAYAWYRLRLQLHSFDRARPRDEGQVSAEDRLRLRLAKTLVTGLIGYLPVQAASHAGRYLLMAKERGDVTDWIGALGFQGYVQSLIEPGGGYASQLLRRMDQLALECGTPATAGFASLMKGTSAYHGGEYAQARRHLAEAARLLRRCSGVDWELDCANIYDQLAASDSGAYADIERNTPSLIEEALRRGRVWAGAMLSGFGVHAWLLPDNAPAYTSVLVRAKQNWREGSEPRWPDFVMLVGESQQLMYLGRPQDAFELFEAQHQRYVKSGISRSAGAGIGGYAAHHAKAAAGALRTRGLPAGRSARLREVLRASVQSLKLHSGAKRRGIAGTLEAALLLDQGERVGAHAALVTAAEVLEDAGVALLAAAARRRAGQLLGGSRGADLIARGDAFMHAQGAKNLEALTEVSCPGCSA